MTFTERFFDFISLALTLDLGHKPPESPDLSSFARSLALELEKEERTPLEGLTMAESALGRFPLLAWLDERILNSNRPDRYQWASWSLVQRHQGPGHGGDLFYQELARLLLARRAAALEENADPRRDSLNPPSLNSPSLSPGLLTRGPSSGLESRAVMDSLEPDEPLVVSEGLSLSALARLWVLNDSGPPNLEAILESYALALVLGFRGRLAAPGLEETLAALLTVAREKLTVSHPLAPEIRPVIAGPSFRPAFWERNQALLWHGLLPALLTLVVFWRGAAIVKSLPF
ncbi:MAG: DotU family type IV/VI secretion system protein [Deltaproteobacteria bacterium]|jgi:type VI protein secretion system component VasF|nr:DotU family type IV/VI secretion system protein [Deltaproteobacteria bacterium]